MEQIITAANHARPVAIKILRTLPDQVEDVMQASLVKALSAASRGVGFEGRNGAGLRTWMTSIIIRESLIALRRHKSRPESRSIPFEDAGVLYSSETSPEHQTVVRDQLDRVTAGLTRKQRLMFRQLAAGFTAREIGLANGRGLANTKSMIFRARKRVRSLQ